MDKPTCKGFEGLRGQAYVGRILRVYVDKPTCKGFEGLRGQTYV